MAAEFHHAPEEAPESVVVPPDEPVPVAEVVSVLDPEAIERILRLRLADAELMSAAERHQLLEWNDRRTAWRDSRRIDRMVDAVQAPE